MSTSTMADKLHDERVAEGLRAGGLDPESVGLLLDRARGFVAAA